MLQCLSNCSSYHPFLCVHLTVSVFSIHPNHKLLTELCCDRHLLKIWLNVYNLLVNDLCIVHQDGRPTFTAVFHNIRLGNVRQFSEMFRNFQTAVVFYYLYETPYNFLSPRHIRSLRITKELFLLLGALRYLIPQGLRDYY